MAAKSAHLRPLRRRQAGRQRADGATAFKQRRGLQRDNAVILIFRDAQIPLLERFEHLPFGHLLGHSSDGRHYQMILVRQRHFHRLGVEVIANQDRDIIAPAGIDGRVAAP
jgi:hypothetical protein